MSNTVKQDGNFLHIIPDGTAAWDSSTAFPVGMKLLSIDFYPSATTDILVVREGSSTGAAIYKMQAVAGKQMRQYYGSVIAHPYLAFGTADCVMATAANGLIMFCFE